MRALVPAAASALCACLLWGLRGRDGSCGASRLLPEVTLGLGLIEVEYFSREVNDLFWTPEALTYFDRYFLRFCCANPAVLRSKGVDASGLRFYSFTSREKY